MNLYLLIAGLVLLAGLLKAAQIVLSDAPEVSEKDSANSPEVKPFFPKEGAIQLGAPEGFSKSSYLSLEQQFYDRMDV